MAAAVVVPVGWLALAAAEAPLAEIQALLLRPKTLALVGNTVRLAAGVVLVSALVGGGLAWVVARSDLPGRGALTVAAVLPLAIPGYVMAYALLGLGGKLGLIHSLFGAAPARPTGFWGALLALSLYNAPFMFLTAKAAFEQVDPGQLEAARALGASPWRAFLRVRLPTLAPALLSGALIVGLYVLGDFGVTSLMRYDTLSYALYLNWVDLSYGAWLALLLVALALLGVLGEGALSRRAAVARIGVGAARRAPRVALGRWRWLVGAAALAWVTVSVVLPLGSTAWWLSQGGARLDLRALASGTLDSLRAAAPGALLAVAVALPLAWAAERRRGLVRAVDGVVRAGYALPPLALALATVAFVMRFAPGLRDGPWLLVGAFAVHFLLLAMGPLRGTLKLLTVRHEEAARSLGHGPLATLGRITLPALRPAAVAGFILCFLGAMKELPLTKLLAPIGRRPLSVRAWGFADEALYAEAAPYALAMVAVSAVTVALVLRLGREAA